jgi:glucose-6-phosphate isomerase
MLLTVQRISAGLLTEGYHQELNRLSAGQAIQKMWSRQASLWKDDPEHARVIANRLGWIDVLDPMRAEAATLTGLAREIIASGVRYIVLLGMGGSSLAPEVFSLIFPAPGGQRLFFVLDSTDPEFVLEVERLIAPARTLFIVASKSGKTIETLSQFQYFHDRLHHAGIRPAGRNFIAITDPGSYLDQLAGELHFRSIFRNPPDIGGRYSALSYFGLLPAALWGVDIASVLDYAIEMRSACGPAAAADLNPALQLGALLGAAARAGDDKLVLLSSPKLAPLSNWIEQLVAESTGKEQKGIVPVAGGAAPPMDVLAKGCVTVALKFEGEDCRALDAILKHVEQRGIPAVEIRLSRPAELGGEFFKWEAATALAATALSIDPFDEPNVQESKDNTAAILAEFEKLGKMPAGSPRLVDSGIELFAEASIRTEISTPQLAPALQAFFAQRRPDDYLALLAYVARNRENGTELDALRAVLTERLAIPVLLGYGPRYMHSIGQLYKGGPSTGMFLVITSQKREDLSIPAAKYTFGQLEMAQALGDLQSLGRLGKPALRLHLTQGVPQGLAELRKIVNRAFSASQPARS